MNNTDVILQARMGSTRLPGKVMKEVLGQPLLHYQLERVRRADTISNVIVATTTKSEDNCIADLCKQEGVDCYRGEELDVLSRYVGAADAYNVDTIVRLTGDCPLMDPAIIELVVQEFHKTECDYAANVLERTYPKGMDVEVFSRQTLEKINVNAKDPGEREHVTLYLYHNPEQFRTTNITYSQNLGEMRLTVDTEEDFTLIARIFEALYPVNPHFTLEEVIQFVKKDLKWHNETK